MIWCEAVLVVLTADADLRLKRQKKLAEAAALGCGDFYCASISKMHLTKP